MSAVYFYCYNHMADFETVLLLHRLHCIGGLQIIPIAETLQPVVSQSGLRYLPEKTIAQAAASEAEALIIPGGPIDNRQNAIIPLIRQMHAAGKTVAAICFGPQFLARAGVLDTVRYTTSCTPEHIAQLGVEDPFPRAGWVPRRVVEDGHVITAQGHAFVDFAKAVCRRLAIGTDPRQQWELFDNIKATEDDPASDSGRNDDDA